MRAGERPGSRLPADPGNEVGGQRPDRTADPPPPPGEMALVMAGLAIGLLLLGIQLWLLAVALELLLSGEGSRVWQLAALSGLIFLGGLGILRRLQWRPRVRRLTSFEGPYTRPD